MKKVFIVTSLMLLTGCNQYFRYPCQNPDNWDEPACKKPLCEVNRDCPSLIFDKQQMSLPQEEKTVKNKGECPK